MDHSTETSREWRERQDGYLGSPQQTGPLLAEGPPQKRGDPDLGAAVRRAVSHHGREAVLRALRVLDTDLLTFAGWFHDIERQAAADREACGGPSNERGERGGGVPLTRARLLEGEVPIHLRRLMEDPVKVFDMLDRGKGLVV
jgi:hypothetical protein